MDIPRILTISESEHRIHNPFTAEKYGENSYYLTFGDAPAGEYGIIVTNPNNVDEKMIIVSAFGIDPEKMPAASGSETAEDTE